MHGDLLAQWFQNIGASRAFQRNQDTDLAHGWGNRIVDIGNDETLGDLNRFHPADRLVFTNGRDIVGQHVLYRAAGRIVGSGQRLDIILVQPKRYVCNLGNKILELVVLGNKVGFAIHLDGDALGPVNGNTDQTFSRRTARFLLRGSQTLGPQQVNRCFNVAIGFVQCLLAIHHACTGALAQFFHCCCCNSHYSFLNFLVGKCEMGAASMPPLLCFVTANI